MKKVTVVIEYEDKGENDVAFGYGMTTDDLPKGNVTTVNFGDALNEPEGDE